MMKRSELAEGELSFHARDALWRIGVFKLKNVR